MWTSKHHLALFLILTFSKTNKNNRNDNNSNCACHIFHKNIIFFSLYLQIWIETAGNWSLAHANGESGREDGKCGRTSRCFRLFCTRGITERAKGLWQWWFSTFTPLFFVVFMTLFFVVDLNSQNYSSPFSAVSRWFCSCHETWNINDFVPFLLKILR